MSESEEEGCLLDLFLPSAEDFRVHQVQVRDVTVQVYASDACSTDFDLTGVIIWPVSVYLGWFLLYHPHLIANQSVLEIGCGCALSGILAAHLNPKCVTITDGEPLVLNVVQNSVHLLKTQLPVHVRQLRWGSQYSQDADTLMDEFKSFDVVIAADVFHPSFGDPEDVFQLVEKVLSNKQQIQFIVGFVDRKNQQQVLDAAEKKGWTFKLQETLHDVPVLSVQKLIVYIFNKQS